MRAQKRGRTQHTYPAAPPKILAAKTAPGLAQVPHRIFRSLLHLQVLQEVPLCNLEDKDEKELRDAVRDSDHRVWVIEEDELRPQVETFRRYEP